MEKPIEKTLDKNVDKAVDNAVDSRITKIMTKITLHEKASLCSGKSFWFLQDIERLGVPSIMVADGPHGLRKQDLSEADQVGLKKSIPATCFPTAVTMASTWDESLIKEVGVALGEECQKEDVSVLLGPGSNIKRSPLCGRNFEYFSEDPYVSGKMATAWIEGVQSQGVGVSMKHFAANNQEENRMIIDAFVDERALREIYLPAFEMAVKKAQPWTVMCSYNKLNGTYASENSYLLTDILKEQWGHTGLVMTDWGANNHRPDGVRAGLEIEMPGNGGINDRVVVEAVKSGELLEADLDKAVIKVLELIFKATDQKKLEPICDMDKHHELAHKVAAEGTVLLKNEGGILPLNTNQKIGLIGGFAEAIRYQGAGSSMINPTKIERPITRGQSIFGDNLSYAKGYDVDTDKVDESLMLEAESVAREAEVVVVMVGLTDDFESEGFDRKHLNMPDNHIALIERVSAINEHVVVLLCNGSPIEMPWIDSVKGVLEMYLGGQAGGAAIWDVLTGVVNPSGKLAETFPSNINDCSATTNFPMGPHYVNYKESIYVGYRYYETAGVDVLFPFGYGLSYTTFAYSDIELDRTVMNDDEILTVTCKIKNTGSVFGKEVVQLYVKDVETSIFRSALELKGFAKVALEPDEEKVVTFNLDKRSFAYYNVSLKDWVVETGEFQIMIGASIKDIRLSEGVTVNT
ncbi:MAG: glycoside hydrolase family 3 C-terminal domain-containing protein, partial [Vallitaleaceae bacterium]|nr:glycoside hydrolase family 3 C-terminal domain-containing protein [Vallitaleaceae bacterium]